MFSDGLMDDTSLHVPCQESTRYKCTNVCPHGSFNYIFTNFVYSILCVCMVVTYEGLKSLLRLHTTPL